MLCLARRIRNIFTPVKFNVRSASVSISHNSTLKYNLVLRRERKTSIICTVGPSTSSKDSIMELLMNGMNCLRLNFSHGSHEDKSQVIEDLRCSLNKIRKEDICSIAADTKGPEIRTGCFKSDVLVQLKNGQSLVLATNRKYQENGDSSNVFVDYKNLANEVNVGQRIFMYILFFFQFRIYFSLDVVSCDKARGEVHCVVNNDGPLGERKGVNIPYPFVSDLPSLTTQDEKDLQ
eukprot:GSMAST32.ASY1.ANO1.1000.1 assembled CDS